MDWKLGVDWKLATDELEFSPTTLISQYHAKPTQRSLHRATSSVLDSSGIAAPLTIRFRIIQQTIWRQGLKWDDETTHIVLPDFFFDTIAELQELSAVAIPTRLFPDKYQAPCVHRRVLFCTRRCRTLPLPTIANIAARSFFVLGKARIAPFQQHTIAKFELQAALLGSRRAKFIQRDQRLTINAIHIWTDSTTVLQWIYGSHQRLQVFVANRVAEKLENTQAHH